MRKRIAAFMAIAMMASVTGAIVSVQAESAEAEDAVETATTLNEDYRLIKEEGTGSLGDDIGTQMYPDYEKIKSNPYSGEVLFVQGIDDQQCILSRSVENMEWYPMSSLTAISGMGHGYGYQMDREAIMVMDNVKEFLYRTVNHIGEE